MAVTVTAGMSALAALGYASALDGSTDLVAFEIGVLGSLVIALITLLPSRAARTS